MLWTSGHVAGRMDAPTLLQSWLQPLSPLSLVIFRVSALLNHPPIVPSWKSASVCACLRACGDAGRKMVQTGRGWVGS